MDDKLGPFALNEIHCVDCLEAMKLLPNKCVDAVVTDPPYGHKNNDGDMIANREAIFGGAKKVNENEYRPIANDGPGANKLFRESLVEWNRVMKPRSTCCCCCGGGGGPDPQFARWSLWLDEIIPFKMAVVWDKGPMGMGHHYRRSYEFILIAQKGNPARWFAESKNIENVVRPGDFGVAKIIPSKDQHPTEKPVELMKHFIKLHTEPGDLILDPFAGSGTTLVAAKQLGRRFLGFEIEEKYCEIARKRLAQEELF